MDKHRIGNGKESWRDADKILEGVSSLHSWIKKQTVIPQTTKMRHIRSTYDDVGGQHYMVFLNDSNIC